MLARPDMEELLEKYKDYKVKEVMEDIWQSSFWWNFKDAEGKPYFASAPDEELRLLFGLGMDGFNPFQSKES